MKEHADPTVIKPRPQLKQNEKTFGFLHHLALLAKVKKKKKKKSLLKSDELCSRNLLRVWGETEQESLAHMQMPYSNPDFALPATEGN